MQRADAGGWVHATGRRAPAVRVLEAKGRDMYRRHPPAGMELNLRVDSFGCATGRARWAAAVPNSKITRRQLFGPFPPSPHWRHWRPATGRDWPLATGRRSLGASVIAMIGCRNFDFPYQQLH